MLERVILASSNPGDLVLDPFGGTFTTGYVAKKHGRRSVSVEINEEYLRIGLRRLGLAQSQRGEKLRGPIKVYDRVEIPTETDAPEQSPLLLLGSSGRSECGNESRDRYHRWANENAD